MATLRWVSLSVQFSNSISSLCVSVTFLWFLKNTEFFAYLSWRSLSVIFIITALLNNGSSDADMEVVSVSYAGTRTVSTRNCGLSPVTHLVSAGGSPPVLPSLRHSCILTQSHDIPSLSLLEVERKYLHHDHWVRFREMNTHSCSQEYLLLLSWKVLPWTEKESSKQAQSENQRPS